MQDYQDRLTLATAEGVELSVVLAGAGSRILARLLDFFLVWIWIILAGVLLAMTLGNVGVALLMVFVFYAFFGYDVMCERLFNGRTLGKRIMGLRVMRAGATRVDLTSSAMRSVLTVLDFWALTPLVAITAVLVAQGNQRLGDLAGSTIVIREPKAGKTAPMTISPQVTTPLAPPQAAAGWIPPAARHAAAMQATPLALDTSAVTREDVAAINAFLERRATLDREIRAGLAAQMAGALRTRVGGGIGDLSDEQLLAAVAEAKSGDE